VGFDLPLAIGKLIICRIQWRICRKLIFWLLYLVLYAGGEPDVWWVSVQLVKAFDGYERFKIFQFSTTEEAFGGFSDIVRYSHSTVMTMRS
jgi:hypothetical protein